MCYNGNPVLVHRQRGTKVSSTKPSSTGSSLQFRAFTTSTLIGYELITEQEMQSKISPRMKNETLQMLRLMLKLRRKSGVPLSQTHQMTYQKRDCRSRRQARNMMHGLNSGEHLFQPDNLGPLPALWLQAKLTISLTSIQEDKFAKLFMTIAAELWLRGRIDTLETVFQAAARNFTIRLAEKLAKYLSSLMRRAETLATLKRNAFSTPRTGFGRFCLNYRGGPHMRSLISIDFPAPEMEPESAHVASAVSVP